MSLNPHASATQADSYAADSCYHCGLPNPEGSDYCVKILGEERPMCCPGCQAVAQAIVGAGLTDFYRHRTQPAPSARELIPDALQNNAIYDSPELQQSFVTGGADDIREAALMLEGITCAACIWLNERHLASLPGVLEVAINYATHRARVRWDNRQIRLSQILAAIAHIGYRAHPYDPKRQQQLMENERRQALRRLGIAGVLGMQVMILAVAMYAGDWFGMESEFRRLFMWLSLGFTLPVLVYSAQPFLRAAWRDLRQRQAGMDVPVSLGILIAFAASGWNTWQGHGHVYFDSVVMFVFFLLTARYFELSARKRASESAEFLTHRLPAMATRLRSEPDQADVEELVAVAQLRPDDRVLLRPGETVPADGIITEGHSSVDESILTGESLPLTKQAGDRLISGGINRASPLVMRVRKCSDDSTLATLARLAERAQAHKPRLARLADRIAARFVLAVLVLATAVAIYWWQQAPQQWLAITIAVLVASCPCALSLATPTAITAASGNLLRRGILSTQAQALETLAQVNHIVFDKTGTLTQGQLQLLHTELLGPADAASALRTATALEQYSEHPIAKALLRAGNTGQALTVTQRHNTPGAGVSGNIDGQAYYLGTTEFIAQHSRGQYESDRLNSWLQQGYSAVLLADQQQLLAAFILGDSLRPGAQDTVAQLKRLGKRLSLLSGDQALAVGHIATQVGIMDYHGAMTPQAKMDYVQQLQKQGEIVAMIGDGINDAPVLRSAHVSIAMGNATQLAAASADMLLLSQQLPQLVHAFRISQKTLTIIRQNLIWAAGYNFTALPLAAAGYVPPWLAAIGMSLSSLLVVANAMRLHHSGHT